MPIEPPSKPDQPSLRRQLWQAKRQHKQRLRLAAGCLAAFLMALLLAGYLGLLRPRGRPVTPPYGVPLPEAAVGQEDRKTPAANPEPRAASASLFRNENFSGLLWRSEGAAEMAILMKAAWPEFSAPMEYSTWMQFGRPVFLEASWVEPLPLVKAKARLKEMLPALSPDWLAPWTERNQCWFSEESPWACALVPGGADETRVILRRWP